MDRAALVPLGLLALGLPTTAPLAQAPGDLDLAFNGSGSLVEPIAGTFYGVVVQPDGRIVAAGTEDLGGGAGAWRVHRYLHDGTADGTFGTGGAVTLFGGSDDAAASVALDASGRILVVGSANDGGHADLTVVRLLPDGSLDASFGSGGVAQVHAGKGRSGFSAGRAIAIQADGRIVVAGYAQGKRNADVCVARLTAGGDLDSSFASKGKGYIVDDVTGSADLVWRGTLAVQADGRILVGSYSSASFDDGWTITRYKTDGKLDNAWGSGGRVTAAFPGFSRAQVEGLAIDASGRVVATGRALSSGPSGYDVFAARYLADGSLDSSFAGAGFASSGFLVDDQGTGGVALQPDGKVVIAATHVDIATVTVSLVAVRFATDGTLDGSFGTGGLSELAAPGGGFAAPYAVALDAAGRITCSGYGASGAPALVRFRGQ